MDLFRNFIGNIIQSMPHVSKVAYVSSHLKKYLAEMEDNENEKFNKKFKTILQKFIDQEITLDQICTIIDAADGIQLNKSQLNYFVNQMYLDCYLIDILQRYIDYNQLNDENVHYVAEFLVLEINKALING
ncbi:hypothetical protein [Ectropis obliqua nucleopolyhedrovirus]|uniref:Putative 8.5 kDa protein n=1 Tax=Ectropis obliqua nucleopolyhedrovirus TaxID=59376 RepID=A0EYW2_9ABAC|nr:hypothetical protein EONV_gp059 [Ectropis obliqua nucleopolyhedrovirus]ABI35742.1 hypothetical protein [Ectropis obliqua nucleopolyhedrovirus]AGS47914.1 putative 8.5 kDa protein [Ectropis obliqua nucleopolyhedrovirus]QWV59672.1 hypothetical protein EONV_gp059 [Ectropis obliqua nucleopolyhedrovirus]UYO72857.1 hypothetical protein EONV-gp059 [Ectropis obliqua nucleopolyhedrovirus]